jgi:hypothetical protein
MAFAVKVMGARCPIKRLNFVMFAWIAADSYMLSVELPLTMTSFFATNAQLDARQGQSYLNLAQKWKNKWEILLIFKISPTTRKNKQEPPLIFNILQPLKKNGILR